MPDVDRECGRQTDPDLEGLGTPVNPRPLQQAFSYGQAVQCGYCVNGMIMQAKALLDTTKRPWRAREPTAAVVSSAIANAIHDALGVRPQGIAG